MTMRKQARRKFNCSTSEVLAAVGNAWLPQTKKSGKKAGFFCRIPDYHRIVNIRPKIRRRRISGTSLVKMKTSIVCLASSIG
jgi:hypothetical protein